MYTFGSAGTGGTYRNNLEALEQWRIVTRMLRDATHRNLDVGLRFRSQATELTAQLPRPPSLAPNCPRPSS
jgi:hypothetical protein